MGSRNHSRKKHQSQPRKSQVDHKFAVDERVLCYEPDLKKARVLYDSKVLEVVERNDNRGKIRVEYKIHFFGWNSSWDRYVAEDCVLKDTEENRDLQKELKTKADVLIQGHLKKKKRKKTLTEILKEATKDKTGKGTKGTSGDTKNDDDSSNSSGSSDSSDQESSDEEEKKTVSQIVLTDRVKALLEQDYYNITTRNMLVRIPAEVSVICVFEGYVKFLGFRELRKIIEQYKSCFGSGGIQTAPSASSSSVGFASANTKTSFSSNKSNPTDLWMEDIARIYRKVRQAQEIVHGLKVIFDYMLYQMLLYDVENEQYKSHKRMKPRMPDINCSLLVPQLPVPGTESTEDAGDGRKKQQKKGDNDPENTSSGTKQNRPVAGSSREQNSETINKLRRHTKTMADDLRKSGDSSIKSSSSCQLSKGYHDSALWIKTVHKYINELKSWQMLPEECYQQEQPDPCMVYGLIHVLRFFVKLPEILNRMLIPRRKVRIIAHHVNQMIDHIQSAYVFSICRLYVCLPRCIYEEDHIRFAPPVTEEEKRHEVKIEVDTDLSQYSTRNHRTIVLAKVKPPLAKVVEVPLSTSADALEEHQLTIRNETTLQIDEEGVIKEGKSSGTSVKATTSSSSDAKISTAACKAKSDIKVEQISPPLQPKPNAENKKKPKAKSSGNSSHLSPPVLPMVRQVRKSAAHAAFKTAHMFASPQSLTSRTLAASTITKQESNQESLTTKKRSSPSEASGTDTKRVTRTIDNRPSTSGTKSSKSKLIRRSRQEKRRRERSNIGTSKPPLGRRESDSPTRSTKDTRISEGEDESKNNRPQRSSLSKPSPIQKNRSTDADKKQVSSDRAKIEAKRISSPRNSKSFSSSKEIRSLNRSSQKSTSPTSNTIRLRSRSDERQLRSKGTLINALSLPMQPTPRSSGSSRSEEDRSPKRRESTGNRDSGSSSQIVVKASEQSHNLRGNRR